MTGRAPVTRKSAYLVAACALAVTIAIVAYPDAAFEASVEGLRVWWQIVFPALLPFFIAAEVLMALGVVHFLGVLLEPLMRPLFDVPGVGAFAFAMGLTGGYPIGARIAASLRRQGLCNQVEAERLVSFTNTADPLFMAGAVAVGMFRLAPLALTICAGHYISAVIVGVLLRLHGGPQIKRDMSGSGRRNLLARALAELHRARQNDGRPFGQLFGDSVRDSVNNMLLIGGFIMMFSVIIRALTVAGVTRLVATPIALALEPLGVEPSLVPPFVSGFFEITLGTELASRAAAPLTQRVMAASAIIAWSGLSVFAQVTAMCAGTDIRMTPYLASRIVQAVASALITLILMTPAGEGLARAVAPVLGGWPVAEKVAFHARFAASLAALGRIMIIMVAVSLVIWLVRRARLVFIRLRP